jgi:hypothetical protein
MAASIAIDHLFAPIWLVLIYLLTTAALGPARCEEVFWRCNTAGDVSGGLLVAWFLSTVLAFVVAVIQGLLSLRNRRGWASMIRESRRR